MQCHSHSGTGVSSGGSGEARGRGRAVGIRGLAERVAALLKFVLSHGCLTPGGAHMGFPECIDAVLNVSELATTAVTRNRSAC